MPVPVKNLKVPDNSLSNMVAWHNLEANTIAVNLDQMKYILISKRNKTIVAFHFASIVIFRVQYILKPQVDYALLWYS